MAVIQQQAHAEFTEDGILVLFANGEVSLCQKPAQALRQVQRRDAEWARGRAEPHILVTSLTWHNCPEGFIPPEVQP